MSQTVVQIPSLKAKDLREGIKRLYDTYRPARYYRDFVNKLRYLCRLTTLPEDADVLGHPLWGSVYRGAYWGEVIGRSVMAMWAVPLELLFGAYESSDEEDLLAKLFEGEGLVGIVARFLSANIFALIAGLGTGAVARWFLRKSPNKQERIAQSMTTAGQIGINLGTLLTQIVMFPINLSAWLLINISKLIVVAALALGALMGSIGLFARILGPKPPYLPKLK